MHTGLSSSDNKTRDWLLFLGSLVTLARLLSPETTHTFLWMADSGPLLHLKWMTMFVMLRPCLDLYWIFLIYASCDFKWTIMKVGKPGVPGWVAWLAEQGHEQERIGLSAALFNYGKL